MSRRTLRAVRNCDYVIFGVYVESGHISSTNAAHSLALACKMKCGPLIFMVFNESLISVKLFKLLGGTNLSLSACMQKDLIVILSKSKESLDISLILNEMILLLVFFIMSLNYKE